MRLQRFLYKELRSLSGLLPVALVAFTLIGVMFWSGSTRTGGAYEVFDSPQPSPTPSSNLVYIPIVFKGFGVQLDYRVYLPLALRTYSPVSPFAAENQ